MRRAAALLLICLLLAGCGAAPEAEPAAPASRPAPEPAAPRSYESVRVYYDSLLSDRGIVSGGELFMAPEALCRYFSLSTSTEILPEGFVISLPGLELKGSCSGEYMEAGGRYFYTPSGCIEERGRIYLPQDALERIFGVKFDFYPGEGRAELSQGVLNLMEGSSSYYEDNFPQEELYWLSRIIYAEAKDQPLAGLIGVGNVVFNRVASDKFPHTVLDVIYQRDGTIQFDPTAAGNLGEPDERSVIAACLCLEGYSTVGDCMFFVNPDRGDASWFEKELEFVISLGDHDFYRSRDNA